MATISCPVCAAPFKEIFCDGVAIDICTRCKGVWLDYGELEALVTKAAAVAASPGSKRKNQTVSFDLDVHVVGHGQGTPAGHHVIIPAQVFDTLIKTEKSSAKP